MWYDLCQLTLISLCSKCHLNSDGVQRVQIMFAIVFYGPQGFYISNMVLYADWIVTQLVMLKQRQSAFVVPA